MLQCQMFPKERRDGSFRAEDTDGFEERVAELQSIVAMLLEKNERLRQQLVAYRPESRLGVAT